MNNKKRTKKKTKQKNVCFAFHSLGCRGRHVVRIARKIDHIVDTNLISLFSNCHSVLRVVEHATGERIIYDDKSKAPTSPTGFGDLLVWENEIKDPSHRLLGSSAGLCVLTDGTTSECTWSFHLGGGSITAQGQYDSSAEWSTLAVTGGTGKFLGRVGVLRATQVETPVDEPLQYHLEFRFEDDDDDHHDSDSDSSSSD
jgi:hypothetical protein